MKRLAVLIVLLATLCVPGQLVAAVDVTNLPSVMVGTICVAKGMRIQDVIAKYEGNPADTLRVRPLQHSQ